MTSGWGVGKDRKSLGKILVCTNSGLIYFFLASTLQLESLRKRAPPAPTLANSSSDFRQCLAGMPGISNPKPLPMSNSRPNAGVCTSVLRVEWTKEHTHLFSPSPGA